MISSLASIESVIELSRVFLILLNSQTNEFLISKSDKGVDSDLGGVYEIEHSASWKQNSFSGNFVGS